MKLGLLILIIALLLLLSGFDGCIPSQARLEDNMKEACKNACRDALASGRNLSAGPCLLDPIPGSDWVCDVAHSPRTNIDNLRENQCSAWHNQSAKHFVEVTPECLFIKAV